MNSDYMELKTNIKGVFERIYNKIDKSDGQLVNDLINLLSFAQSESDLLTNVMETIEVKYGVKEARTIMKVATLKAVFNIREERKTYD